MLWIHDFEFYDMKCMIELILLDSYIYMYYDYNYLRLEFT